MQNDQKLLIKFKNDHSALLKANFDIHLKTAKKRDQGVKKQKLNGAEYQQILTFLGMHLKYHDDYINMDHLTDDIDL